MHAMSSLPSLLTAVLDQTQEGVVVLGERDELLYMNPAARERIMTATNGAGGSSPGIRAALARLGARIAPLTVGGARVGKAAFLPMTSQGVVTLAERERKAIVEVLEATGWRLTESARRLGISRTTLWRRLKAYGLDRGS
jgi:transcriptional regulator of acetoin/glycerol metabolism